MSRQYSASSSGGSPPPATNVRVMSAQQREALSRGQMSTTTGSPGAIGPEPDSCPIADCAPWETITSSGSSQPCSSRPRCIAARTSSLVRPGAQLADQRRARRAIAASAAFWARRMPSSCARGLDPPAADELVVVDRQLDRRRRAGGRRRRAGTRAARAARRCRARCAARSASSASIVAAASSPGAISSSRPSVAGSMTSMPVRARPCRRRARRDGAARRPSASR